MISRVNEWNNSLLRNEKDVCTYSNIRPTQELQYN